MVTKKAVFLVDLLLEGDIKLRDGMADPLQIWNSDNDKIHSMVQTFAELLDQNILILKTLRKELVGNCKHPKRMRDKTSKGQWYCMNCNLDL